VVYVFDASAFIVIPLQVDGDAHVLDELGEYIERGVVCFPDAVVDEVARLARDEHLAAWIRAIRSVRTRKAADFKALQWVLHKAERLVDKTTTHESSPPHVVALAVELRDAGVETTVVTEDMHDKPTRMCMREACDIFDLDRTYLMDCLERLGLVTPD
jgi:hypothetical protein